MSSDETITMLRAFATLYGCGLDPNDEALHAHQRPITRRMAYCVWHTATVLHDEWRGFARDFEVDEDLWSTSLPPVAARHADPTWLARFARCFKDIADRLEQGTFGDYGVTNCTGDEVALQIVLVTAADLLADDALALPSEFHAELVPCGDDDLAFGDARTFLAADSDVDVLWDPSMDGIEDTTTPANYVNLHPRDWFLPFD